MPNTPFEPAIHGFRFTNDFRTSANRIGPLPDLKFGGLCGGMSYAALDYFLARKTIPAIPFRPMVGDPLEAYIFDRQQDSIIKSGPNIARWAELTINPFGARNAEFYGWGIADRLVGLRAAIDAGRPVPLGLKGAAGSDDHQVLAIGYDMGRYRGDKGDHVEDLQIQLYDPNVPGERAVLIPQPRSQNFAIGARRYQTYFVDDAYRAVEPPSIEPPRTYPMDGLVHEVHVEIVTGADDLRGGNDNVTIVVHFADRTAQALPNANRSQRWIDQNSQRVPIVLTRPVARDQLSAIEVKTSFGGGLAGDNWNVDQIRVLVLVDNRWEEAYSEVGSPLVRFTGQNVPYFALLQRAVSTVDDLILDIHTGGDDLRGGRDTVNATVSFRTAGRAPERFENLNQSRRWVDNSRSTVRLPLSTATHPEDLEAVTLQTTLGGGFSGDNWDVDRLVVRSAGAVLFDAQGRPLVRFDGNNRPFVARLETAGDGGQWEALPGLADDIGIGPTGEAWVIGRTPVPGGFDIHRWDGSAWHSTGDGGALRIAVGPDGPWIVNSAGQIFRRLRDAWQQVAGAATDIAVGGDGSVWIIGRTPRPGGYNIARLDGSRWIDAVGGATSIATSRQGRPWVVNDVGQVFELTADGFRQREGAARDIGVGADNSVWIVMKDAVPGGGRIARLERGGWRSVDGAGVRISVASGGLPWIVNDAGQIFRRQPAR